MLQTKLIVSLGVGILSYYALKNLNASPNYTSFETETSLYFDVQNPGKEIYADFCMQCHGANGKGDGKNFPPLDGSDWLKTKRMQSIAAVKYGQNGDISVNKIKYKNAMPPMGLSNQEVADVMNYIMSSWNNKQAKIVTEMEVAAIKK